MIVNYTNTWFFTATILEWKPLLKNDKNKSIIIDTLQFLVKDNRIVLFGFVIMPNHIHLIWNTKEGWDKNLTQGSLLRFTANSFIKEMKNAEPLALESYRVNAADRALQIWERNPLSIEIYTDKIMQQKLNYIHNNPCVEKWKLAATPEDYYFSSARFYADGVDDFNILTSYLSL
jgi:REP element-mobilizing transposase RayT